jgi:uncharacterized protein (DUF2236 family)
MRYLLCVAKSSPPSGAPTSFQLHREAVRDRLRRANHPRPGPRSISWKLNREIVSVAAWGRAVLLQLAHPSVAAGVHDHSSFRGSLLSSFRRTRSTVGAMLSLTFGDTEQMISAAAGINTIHDRVNGRVRDGVSQPYSAHDSDLQRWVHATLVESIPLTHELLFGPLTTAEKDQYCREAAIMEPLLGMPSGWLPRSTNRLDAYMEQMLLEGGLVVTPTSRAIARALLYPPHWYLAWPVYRPMQLLAIGLLPPAIRQAYGFQWRAREQRAFRRWTALLRLLLRLLPPALRHFPVARQATASMASTGDRTSPPVAGTPLSELE